MFVFIFIFNKIEQIIRKLIREAVLISECQHFLNLLETYQIFTGLMISYQVFTLRYSVCVLCVSCSAVSNCLQPHRL